MAKLIEELIVIKISKLVRDNTDTTSVLSDDQRAIIADSIDDVICELLNESSLVIEIADLE
jgi:hypothetical protein